MKRFSLLLLGDLPQLDRCLAQPPARAAQRLAHIAEHFVPVQQGIAALGTWLSSAEVTDAADPLPPHLAEAGAALRYVLKGVDIIPDSVPGLGLADDEWIVRRVLQRNPALHGPTS